MQNTNQPEDQELTELLEAVAPFFPKIQLNVVLEAINDKSHPDWESTREHYIGVLKGFKETFEKMPKTYDTEPDDPEDDSDEKLLQPEVSESNVETMRDEPAQSPEVNKGEVANAIPKGPDAIVYLHYFIAGCDWYITEKDSEDEQRQAFGVAQLNGDPEYSYISITELCEIKVKIPPFGFKTGVELDFYWKPKPLKDIPALKSMFS